MTIEADTRVHGRKTWLLTLRRVAGEVLIIVTGVLIALAVDSWSADRAAQRTEEVYLRSLAEDVQQDLLQLDSALAVIDRRRESTWAALRTIRLGSQVHDTLTLVRHLSAAALLWNYRPIDHTFEDLKNTGNLQLIRSHAVRREVADYYNVLFLAFDEWIQESFWTRFRPVLYTYLDAADVATAFYAEGRVLENTDVASVQVTPHIDIDGLRGDPAVRRALEMNILTMTQQLSLLAGQREKGAQLLEVLTASTK